MADALVAPLGEQARVRVGTFGRGPVPLELAIRGAGYEFAACIPPTYADSQLLAVDLRRPAG